MKEKEKVIERDDKIGTERDGKDMWKNHLPLRLLWLVRKGLSPSGLEEAKPASCIAQKRLEKYFSLPTLITSAPGAASLS